MKRLFGATLLLVALALTAIAQSNTGNLVVNVSDASGVIPGATVIVKDEQTNAERTFTTGSGGSISVPQLDVGTFTITVSAPGRKTSQTTGVKIDIAQTTVRNVVLEPGEVTEVVEVVAGTEVINAANAELGNTVSSRQIQELPLNGRNPLTLINLQAGSSSNGATNTVINGQRSSFTNITRDGLNVQDNFIRANATDFVPDRPNTDDVGEFTITTQNAGVEAGYGASQVALVTPRGSNRFTGAAYIYNRNSVVGANTFERNRLGQARPFLNRNQFGGRVGGPILKNRLFFFAAYEGFRQRQSASVTRTTLRPDARNGIFTYVDNAGVTRTLNLFTAQQGGGPAVVGIDSVIQSRILSTLPTGNNTNVGDGRNTIGYTFSQKQNQDREAFSTRIDYDLNAQNTINGVWSYREELLMRPDIDGAFGAGFTDIPFGFQDAQTYTTNVAWRYTPSATLTNELRVANQLSRPAFGSTAEVPAFYLTVPLVSSPEVNFEPQGRDTSTWLVANNAVYTWGDHTIRFGGQIYWFRINPFGPGLGAITVRPRLAIGTSASTPTILNNATNFPGGISTAQLGTANALLGLLGGIVTTAQQSFNITSRDSGYVADALPNRRLHFENYSWYLGDSWRVNQQLTLNFGVRHEIFTPVSEPDGLVLEPVINGRGIRETVLDPNGTYDYLGTNHGDNRMFRSDIDNIAPSISLAWAPNFGGWLGKIMPGEGRSVIRGGLSINYVNDEFIRAADNALLGNAGLSASNSLTGLNGRLSTFNASVPTPAFQVPRTYAQNNALAGNFGTVFAVDPEIEAPSLLQWNIGVQRELPWKTALEVRYVGNKSDNLVRGFDYNQVIIKENGFLADFLRARANMAASGGAAGNPNCAPNPGCVPLTLLPTLPNGGLLTNATIRSQIWSGIPADLATLYVTNPGLFPGVSSLFLPNPNTGVADVLTNGAESNYHSLQIEMRRRFADGLYFQGNYTFAKALSDAAGTGQTRFDPLIDNDQQRNEYAVADFDQRHVFNFNAIYELPFGKGKRFLNQGGWVDQVIGGWQLTGILRWSSGAPFSFTDPRGTLNRAGRAGRQTAVSNLTQGEIANLIQIIRTPCGVYWINPSVININQANLNGGNCGSLGLGYAASPGTTPFSGQVFFNVEPGQTGTLPRNGFRGPSFMNVDLSMFKNFQITERIRFQVRGEAFNLFNRANFFIGNTPGNINSTTFGRVSSTFDPRIFQFVGRIEF